MVCRQFGKVLIYLMVGGQFEKISSFIFISSVDSLKRFVSGNSILFFFGEQAFFHFASFFKK